MNVFVVWGLTPFFDISERKGQGQWYNNGLIHLSLLKIMHCVFQFLVMPFLSLSSVNSFIFECVRVLSCLSV